MSFLRRCHLVVDRIACCDEFVMVQGVSGREGVMGMMVSQMSPLLLLDLTSLDEGFYRDDLSTSYTRRVDVWQCIPPTAKVTHLDGIKLYQPD